MSDRHHHSQSRTGSQSRLTCEPCRERKVKCNRAYPSCSRCARLGYSCSYRDRISYRAGQSALISQLQERVRQAEALLALQASGAKLFSEDIMTSQPTPPSRSIKSSSASACIGKQDTESVTGSGSGICEASMTADFNMSWLEGPFFEDTFDSMPMPNLVATDMETTPMFSDNSQRHEWPSVTGDGDFPALGSNRTPESPPTSVPAARVTATDLNELHQVFFNQIHPVMPILSKDRFYKDLEKLPNSVAVKSVSYAVALLATTITETHPPLKGSCYALARHYVDECESSDGFDSLRCINFLQALLLLTRFEINNRSCARAWLTLGRAIRLAKMMRLDQMDHPGGFCPSTIGLPEIRLSATHDLVELEERRRCLWALYVLEGLASVYTGTPGMLEDSRLQVSLPSPGDLDVNFKPASMPALIDVHQMDKPELLTPFCGLVLVISAMRRVLEHTTYLTPQGSREFQWHVPGFWDRHYSLLKMLNTHELLLEPLTSPRALYSDAVAFNLFLVFHAVKLMLYEAAIEESERQGLPAAAGAESVSLLTSNALKIATAVRSSWGHQRFNCDNLSLSGAFVGWPLYMAIKALTRFQALSNQKRSRASTIQMLQEALDDVELSDGPWHELLLQVSSSPRPWKRHS